VLALTLWQLLTSDGGGMGPSLCNAVMIISVTDANTKTNETHNYNDYGKKPTYIMIIVFGNSCRQLMQRLFPLLK